MRGRVPGGPAPQLPRLTHPPATHSIAMRIFLAFALLCSSLAAQIVEDFEHGNESLYLPMNPGIDSLDVVPSAARDGSFGAQFSTSGGPAWRGQLGLVTAPGNTYDCFVRLRGSATIGRTYVGYGASATGCISAVVAPNTNQILLLNSTNWGFVTLASAAFSFATDTWYVLRFEWATNGDATVRLLDETRTTTLASTATVATTFLTPGGIALRGFTTTTGTIFHDLDTIEVAAMAQVYGTGCGAPVPLALNCTAPVLGTSWDFTTTNIDPVSPFAITFFALAQTSLPLDPLGAVGCFAQIDTLVTSAAVPNVGGTAVIGVPLPGSATLAGSVLTAQSICLTLGNPLGLYTSNGVIGTLGL